MGAALADNDALDLGPADGAGLAGPPIHPEMILELSTAVDPIDARAIVADAFLQHFPDGHPEDLGFVDRHRVRVDQWMEPGEVQGFICVNVPQPGNEGLIQQERFQQAVLPVEGVIQPGGGELIGERLGTETVEDLGWVVFEPDPPEFARVGKDQGGIFAQFQNETVMLGRLVSADHDQHIAAHAQVDQQAGAAELQAEELGPAEDFLDLLALDEPLELCRGRRDQRALPIEVGRQDRFPDEGGTQEADDGFDFRKFRHGQPITSLLTAKGTVSTREILPPVGDFSKGLLPYCNGLFFHVPAAKGLIKTSRGQVILQNP